MIHLVIGGGSIGKRHLKNLFLLGEQALYCYRRKYDKDFETEFNCKIITSVDEVKSLKPDVIYVCNPTSLHHEGLQWAQELGAHLFMEKPLTHSESILQDVRQKWSRQHVFFIGFVLRFHPLVKIIREKLKDKTIGEVYSARFEFGSFLPNWHPWEDYKEGYAASSELGGGVINTITHELDLMLYLFGTPESVTAAKVNTGHLQIDVEDLAESIFRYPWGLSTLHVDFLQKDYDRQIRILGTEGKMIWNWHENTVVIKRFNEPGKTIEIETIDFNEYYLEELKDFFELIRLNQIHHPLDFDYAITNTQWMLGIHKSAETKKTWAI